MADRAEPLVRKTVTVLFCDVTGFTSLGERMDPETMRRVMLHYFDEVRTVLERHGGTVEKFIGDAVMAVFGVPVVHEDDALRAVRAADEMRRALARLNVELVERYGVRLEERIGINTGEVVVGDPTTQQTVATGDALNVAARLQQAAQPGEILLGRETHRLVVDRVRAGPLETFHAKGKSEPVSSWRLDEVRAGADLIFRRLDSPLVGREHERDRLQAAYRAALEEQSCRLVTVLGMAGVGKSRLAQEVAARSFGATVAQGRCLSYGEGITFFPVTEIVRSLAGLAADDVEGVVRGRIAQLLPTGDESALVTERLVDLLSAAANVRAEEVFWAGRTLLEAVARSRPLVLIFEDLHWAEPTLLDLVEYLVGWSRGAPILAVALARPDLLELRPAWPGEHITLEPLEAGEVRALLGNLLGTAELDAEIARRIELAAEGNPLFVEELVRMLLDDGALVLDDGRWVARDVDELPIPPSISALLAARLDLLDPEEKTVLQCASVVGKQFWWSAVAELAPPDLRERVSSHLHALVRKRLVFPAESTSFANEDSFRFGHILVRDAAYATLPKTRRAELHEGCALWLERKAGDRSPEYAEILAYHLEQAYDARLELGPADEHTRRLAVRAGEFFSSAGRRALAQEDVPAAVRLLSRALDLLPPDWGVRTELLTQFGSVLIRAGAFEKADAVLTEAIAGAGDARSLQLRATIERQFLRLFTAPEGSTQEILEIGSSVVPELEELGDELGLSKAWQLLGEVHTIACRWGARAEALGRALEHARRASNRRQEASLIGPLGHALLYGPTPVDEAIARCECFLADSRGNRAVEAAMLSAIGSLRAARGEFDVARQLCAQAAGIYDDLGLPLRQAVRSLERAEVEILAGDPAAAERQLRAGYDTAASIGNRSGQATLAAFLANVLCALGRYDEALELADESVEAGGDDDVATNTMSRCARGKALAHRGELETAEKLLRAADELAASTDWPSLQATALLSLAEVLAEAGKSDEAAAAATLAEEVLTRKGNVVGARLAATLVSATAA
jgi:class 3 adenylate cyclase/tetratricopeptide (TPR) repeat protein